MTIMFVVLAVIGVVCLCIAAIGYMQGVDYITEGALGFLFCLALYTIFYTDHYVSQQQAVYKCNVIESREK